MNILYNLAALYSQLALSANRNTTDGLKTAASWFSHAAGVLDHIKTKVLPELRMPNPPDDMDESTLDSLTQLLLAQSQECFWQKAVTDKYKDAVDQRSWRRGCRICTLGQARQRMKSEAISSS